MLGMPVHFRPVFAHIEVSSRRLTRDERLDAIPPHQRTERDAVRAYPISFVVAGLGVGGGRAADVAPLHIQQHRDAVGDRVDHPLESGASQPSAQGLEKCRVGLVSHGVVGGGVDDPLAEVVGGLASLLLGGRLGQVEFGEVRVEADAQQ